MKNIKFFSPLSCKTSQKSWTFGIENHIITKRSVREVKYSLHSGPFICGFFSWTARQSINIRKTGYLRVYDRIHAWATTKQEQQIRKQNYCLWKFELNCHIKLFWRLFLLQPFNLWLCCSVNIEGIIKTGSINFLCHIMDFKLLFLLYSLTNR